MHDIEIMQALVEQHAAAFPLPGSAPSTAGIVSLGPEPIRHDPAYAHHLAHLPALDQLLDFEITRLGAKLEHAGENHFGILAVRGDQPFGIGFVRRDRFFDHGMDALVQRRDAQCGMLVMRRGNDDGINQPGANQLFAIRENLERFVPFQFARDGIGNRSQFGPTDLARREIAVMVLPDIAHANNA